MKVLVTGGAGFIGSNLVRGLLNRYGFEITVIDDLFTGNKDNLKDIFKDIEFIEASVLDYELLKKVVQNKDLVFHLAARNIIISSQDPVMDLEVNAKGTLNVLKACQQSGYLQKIVYASTSSIYGTASCLPINENDQVNFLSFYSVSKFAGEGYCNVFYELYGLPVAIIRYSNVYGYHQTPSNPYCGVIGKFIEWALKNEPLLIHGDGKQTRDFTFVEDAVNATIDTALSARSTGGIYNIGTGCETTINQLAQHIIQSSGSTSAIKHIDRRDIDNIRRRVLDIEQLRHDIRYSPNFSLEQGIELTIAWFKETMENASLK